MNPKIGETPIKWSFSFYARNSLSGTPINSFPEFTLYANPQWIMSLIILIKRDKRKRGLFTQSAIAFLYPSIST
jgi:hypothetical protein